MVKNSDRFDAGVRLDCLDALKARIHDAEIRGALLQALDRLKPGDRFGILQFSHHYQEFSPQPLPATAENLGAARQYVQNLQAGGGTEMLPALLHLVDLGAEGQDGRSGVSPRSVDVR